MALGRKRAKSGNLGHQTRSRQLDDFASRSKAARHVEETRVQPERAVLHPLFHERAHLLQLVGGRVPIDRTDDGRADRSLADEAADVDLFAPAGRARGIRSDVSGGRAARVLLCPQISVQRPGTGTG